MLKDLTNDGDVAQKCLYIIEKTGYMKFLNHSIGALINIPL